MLNNFVKNSYPEELLSQQRWIPVNKDKKPSQIEWYNHLHIFTSPIFYKTSVYRGYFLSKEPYYVVFDFDHVLENGNFTNSKAEEIYNMIQDKLSTYCEISISNTGLHLIAKPTEQCKFSGNFRITFDNNSFLEVYYIPNNRYFLLTGYSNNKPINNSIVVDEVLDYLFSKRDLLNIKNENTTSTNENPGRILNILYSISPDSNRQIWIECLWTCKQLGLSKEEFRKWSKQSYKYHESDFEKQWNDAINSNWTIGTLIYYAKQNGWVDLFAYPHNKIGAIDIINYLYKHTLKYIKDTNEWALYKDGYWEISNTIFPNLSELYVTFIKYLYSIAPNNKNDMQFINALSNPSYFEDILHIYKGINSCDSNMFNMQYHLLNVNNGVIDLKTGKLLKHSSDYMFTYKLSTDYNPNAKSNIINNFFESILPDSNTRKALLRFLGYCLTGETKEQKALFICGSGGNGKSVLIQIIKSLMEDLFTMLDESTLAKSTFVNKGKATPCLLNLKWKHLFFIDKIPLNYNLDSNMFKRITGGSQLNIRGLFERKERLLEITTKIILSGNNMPHFYKSNSIRRRVIFIEFNQDFTQNKDVNLLSKLKQHLPTLLNILVQESISYYKDGLIESDSMVEWKNNYLENINDIEQSIIEYVYKVCKLDINGQIKRKELLEIIKNNMNLQIKDKDLTNYIVTISGVKLNVKHHTLVFTGLTWK